MLDARSSRLCPSAPFTRRVASGLSEADVQCEAWVPVSGAGARSLLGTLSLGDGLLLTQKRQDGNHHNLLAHPAVLSFFFFFLLSQTLASKITSIGNPPSTSSMVHTVGFLCCCVCPACLSVPLLLNASCRCVLTRDGEGTSEAPQSKHWVQVCR